jgi:hypothetical protein
MTRYTNRSTRRSASRALIALSAVVAIAVAMTAAMRASDNIDFAIDGQIHDGIWDSRLFDGTAGYPGAILWHHNPAGMPTSLDQASFEATVETSFNTWESVDNGIPEEPLVPVVNFGGQTAIADAFALDGVNVIAWQPEFLGGTLAVTPCWVLDAPTTTAADATGKTVMPIDGGSSIPFPGAPGVTYPAGTIIDCGMRFDSLDSWSTTDAPDPNGFDVQSVATHEGGHFIGVSHSTLGDFTGIDPMSATMLPLAAPGDTSFRTLEEDDKASVLRVYARNRFPSPLPAAVGGRGVITFRLVRETACVPATGVSVVAYRTASGIDGAGRVETFSGSQLRPFTTQQPYSGSVTLNVPPLPPGESYTIYARTLEEGTGALAAQRYNYTTINSNLLDPENGSRTFDHLATVDSLSAGEMRSLGDIGILGCTVADPNSPINLVATSMTAPATAYKGTAVPISSSFQNQGSIAAGSFEAGIYFSTDQIIDAADIFSGFSCTVPGLAAGAVAQCNGSAPIPSAVIPGTYYVGLVVDRQNQVIEYAEGDNGIAATNSTMVFRNPLDPIVNGSFETGDLSGWTVKELAPKSNPSLPVSVHGAGVEYPASTFLAWPYFIFLDYFTSAPTDGQFALLHDFNGDDPATSGTNQFVNRREVYQDVVLPSNTTTLEFDYRAAWELFRFGSTQDRTFSVEIEPAGGGAALTTQTILIAPNGTYEEDTDNPSGGVGDYPPAVVDLSAYASQSVRIKFVWNIPEPGTGFGFFQLDNVRLNTSSAPTNAAPVVTIVAPDSGVSRIVGQSITFVATATDPEDGTITGNISWASNRDGTLGSGGTISTSALTVGSHLITASVLDSGGRTASASISVTVNPIPVNTAPTVTIAAPATNATFVQGGSITFTGSASDAQDGNISSALSWSSDLDGVIGTGASFSTTALRAGRHVVTASVTDTGGLPASATISIVVNVENVAAEDVSTARGTVSGSFQQTWTENDSYQTLTESLTGTNSRNRRSQLEHVWRFDVVAGTQYVFAVNAYRTGTEDSFTFSYSRDNVAYTPMVTVSAATDDDSLQTYVFPQNMAGTVYIRVQDTDSTAGSVQLDSLFVDFLRISTLFEGGANPPGITLAASGYKVKGLQQVELAWSGATTPSVTIARDGVVIRTVSNPGPAGDTYIDNIGIKGSATYAYQVCETGTGVCSNIAAVTF